MLRLTRGSQDVRCEWPLGGGNSPPCNCDCRGLPRAPTTGTGAYRWCAFTPTTGLPSTPSAQLTSPSAQLSTPSAQLTSPSAQLSTPSAQLSSPSAQLSTPSAQLTSPSAQLSTPSAQLSSPSAPSSAGHAPGTPSDGDPAESPAEPMESAAELEGTRLAESIELWAGGRRAQGEATKGEVEGGRARTAEGQGSRV